MQVPACSYPSTNNPDISFFFFTLPRAGNIVKFEGFVWRLRGFLIGEIRIYHEDAKFSLFFSRIASTDFNRNRARSNNDV